jgi:acetoin utilization deacetylase AcuC-like enzyme
LGQFRLSKVGLQRRDQYVIHWFRERGVSISLAMAGGYAPDCNDIVDIHLATIQSALTRYLAEKAST